MSGVPINAALCVLLVAGLAAGCGQEIDTPTSPSAVATSTRLFTGTIPVQGSGFYSFQVFRAGVIDVALVSLTTGARGPALTTVMGLGSGTPNGTDCELTTAITTAPGLTNQLIAARAPGVHCVKLFDIGHLTTTVNFAVRIVHP